MSFTIRPRRIAAMLLTVVAVLTLLSVGALYLRFGLGHERVAGLIPIRIFHLDSDVSIPGWYSATALLVAAVVVATVAAAKRARQQGYVAHWVGLAVALCYLSADESARLHEQSTAVLLVLFERDTFYTRSWTVPAALAVAVFAAAYVPFLRHLEARQRLRFVAAGAMFVVGAVGMEVLGHEIVRERFPVEEYGIVPYQLMVHLEELLEMCSVILLIYTALRELASAAATVELRLSRGESVARVPSDVAAR